MSVVFDAATGRLRKVWAGGLRDGKTEGDAYAEDLLMNPTWRVRQGNSADRVPAVFRGYRIRKGVATLLYDIPFQGQLFRIEETLTATENRLERVFNPIDLPKDVRLSLTIPLDLRQPASTSGSLADAEETGMSPSSMQLTLRNDSATVVSTTFSLAAPGKLQIPSPRPAAKAYETSDRPFPFTTSLVSEVPADANCFEILSSGRAIVGDRSRVFILATGQTLASGLDDCLALHMVGGKLLALQRGELTELTDLDQDGVFDQYMVRATGWASSNARDFSVTPDGTFIVTDSGVVTARPDGTIEPSTETISGATSVSTGPNQQRLVAAPGAFVPWAGGSPLRVPTHASPSNMVPIVAKPFAGQYVFGRTDGPGTWRWIPEVVNGTLQGAMIPISGAWSERLAGPNFFAMGGGQLVTIRPRTGTFFEIVDASLFANGIELVLSESLSEGMGLSVEDYTAETWEGKAMPITTVSVNRWRNRVFLEIPSLASGQLLGVRLNQGLTSTSNRLLGARDLWYSVGRVPAKAAVVTPTPEPKDPAGFSPLALTAKGGQLWSNDSLANFELRFRWRSTPGGATALYLRVPGEAVPAKTSLRVLLGAPTGGGSLDFFEAAKHRPLREPGHWNDSRLIVQAGVVEHWLNGLRVWRFNLDNVNTRARVAESEPGKNPGFAKARAGMLVFEGGNALAASLDNIRVKRTR